MRVLYRSLAGLALVLAPLAAGCNGDNAGPDAGPPEYLTADGLNGGRLYDHFWASEARWNQADARNATFNAYPDFFRCKQCHGWDRIGTAGAYISRGPTTKRPNVSSVNLVQAASLSPEALFEAIKRSTNRRALSVDLATYNPTTNPTEGDRMPDYGAILSDQQIWELVRFLKVNAIDWRNLYDLTTTGSYPTGAATFAAIGKDGDAARGDAIFAANCAYCHGANGAYIKVDGAAYTVGRHVRAKPYEDQHKVRFGQLGSAMLPTALTLQQLTDLYKALTNSTKYPD